MANFFDIAGEEFGGNTGDFQQGNVESYGFINLDPGTSHGACYALSVLWMIQHKKKENFFDWVKRPSGIKAMNNLFCTSISVQSQDNHMNKYLENNGLARRIIGDAPRKKYEPDEFAMQIIKENGYKNIGYLGNEGGHAVAAIILDNESKFFDPNYGQVSFRSKINLAYWYVKWWKSNNFYKSSLNRAAEIFNFA